MRGEMLGAGSGLQIFSLSLQTLDETDAQAAGQIRILPVGFMAPLRVGAVRGWLKDYDNLKYPFSSLLQ